MNGSDQITSLRLLEERLANADISKGPYQLRLDLKKFTDVRIAGYTHLPVEKQLIQWAIARGYLAREAPLTNEILITKQQ